MTKQSKLQARAAELFATFGEAEITAARDALLKAAKLVRKGWCQYVCAADKNGDECDYTSRAAVKFCAVGAYQRAMRDKVPIELSRILESLDLTTTSASYWNDAKGRTAEEVAQKLEAAANALTKGE